jgi:hypothetical protein
VPLQNRVTPLGELIATRERGLVYGNRGCLHDRHGRIIRRYGTTRWIACRLQFRGRRRTPLMAPGRFTELFFLDDATAFAAGHRPCAECRHADYERLMAVWSGLHPGQRGADAIDTQLQSERVGIDTGERRFHLESLDELADGVFVMRDGRPFLVLGSALLQWSAAGYVARIARPHGELATVITPPSLVALLRASWTPLVPLVHPSADPLVHPSADPLMRAAHDPVAFEATDLGGRHS